MRQASTVLTFATHGRGLLDITREVCRFVEAQGVREGLATVFCRHTSASLLVQENADPSVQRDLLHYFETIAPESGTYEHDEEGADDMPAHLRAALTQTHLSIPVLAGRPALGVWQAIYLFEHRRRPHRREIVLHVLGA